MNRILIIEDDTDINNMMAEAPSESRIRVHAGIFRNGRTSLY